MYENVTQPTATNDAFFFFLNRSQGPDVPHEAEKSVIKEPPSKISHNFNQGNQMSKCVQPRVRHILPPQCIICRRDKTVYEHFIRKIKKEKWTLCETISAGKLVLAAEMRRDEKILIEIRRKDLFALEVRYHLNCYRDYTRFLTKRTEKKTLRRKCMKSHMIISVNQS